MNSREKVYAAICRLFHEQKFCPSQQEISDSVGLSRQTVAFHIRHLEKSGRVKSGNGYRTLQPVEDKVSA